MRQDGNKATIPGIYFLLIHFNGNNNNNPKRNPMTSVDLVMARHSKKKLMALQELYFDALEEMHYRHPFDSYHKSQLQIKIWEYSREIKELDQKLTKYYEHTKINNQQLPTVGQMGVTRVTQKLGDHDLKIRSYFIHN